LILLIISQKACHCISLSVKTALTYCIFGNSINKDKAAKKNIFLKFGKIGAGNFQILGKSRLQKSCKMVFINF